MTGAEIKEFLKDWKRIGSSSRCHFIKNLKTHEKVLIPMCWGSINESDLDNCNCSKSPQTKESLEKEILEKEIISLKERIRELEEKLC